MAKKPKAEVPEKDADEGKAEVPETRFIASKQETAKPEAARRRISRGSTRRLERAAADVSNALANAIREIDFQVYEADEDGNRIGEAPIVADMRRFRDEINQRLNALIYQ